MIWGMEPVQDLITASEAGKPFGVSGETMRRWAREGRVPAIVLPSGRVKFSRIEIAELAKSKPVAS